jgi:hypothetical protein
VALLPNRLEAGEHRAISTSSIVVSAKDQVSCKLGEDFMVLSLRNSCYYGLEQCGGHVWGLLQGRRSRSVAELRDSILEKYEVEKERTETDLFDLLGKMRTSGLIEVHSAQLVGSEELSPLTQPEPKRPRIEGILAGDSPCSKKPYLKPHFQVYGRIQEITRNGGTGPAGDNRYKNNSRTGG